ncbi:MAG: MFS transporter [Lutibacter sp.]|uniref:peptide MFS transporter n=1 Tax=Lutibacter sp. TaxID=1925666 RepID=UPI0019EA08FD|nr:peptide MFS transporter [Lutibacter sp.]NOR27195.1 MFS transporter [Lutibacter sp.]
MADYIQENEQQEILGHPIGLFVLFFTEMWERFSYYGMRALLILFLVAKIEDDGWGWSRTEAFALYGWYVMLVYLLPLLGGWLADNKWGHVKTVIVGAAIITLGHTAMAVSDLQMGIDLKFVFYLGLFLIVLGTGLFKPNMSSIVGKMYAPQSDKKDGAYTIFYMGVNSGAFIGTLLVGWIGETFSWTWGFGLAGIFMLFGLLQFYFARSVFGKAASEPNKKTIDATPEEKEQDVPFTKTDLTIAAIGGFFAISWIVDGLYSVVSRGNHFLVENLFEVEAFGKNISVNMSSIFFLLSLVVFITLGFSRLKRFQLIERDRLKVVFIIAFFVIFFWASFEQAGTTMNIFARDYTNRTLIGNWGLFYKIIDFILSIAPMLILTWVIYKLAKAIIKKYPLTILFTSISFIIIWVLVLLRVYDKVFAEATLVDTSWFQILNPVFIISLAPLYSMFWKKYTFSGPQKFFMGLTLLAAGFGMLAIGSMGITPGAQTASVSMVWLLLAYLLHTMGELAVSPVGLSYVSKLAPARMLAFLFGIWYVFTGMAGKLASIMAEYSDGIAENIGLSGFFLIFTIIPFVAGLVMLSLNKPLKRMMHGIDK